MTLGSRQTFGARDNLDTKSCSRLKKKFLKMEQFFVLTKNISFLSFKQMFDADAALDSEPV